VDCEKCCLAVILRLNGGLARQAAFVWAFAALPAPDGNWWGRAGPHGRTGTRDVDPRGLDVLAEIAWDTIVRRGKPYLIV
jgi:hypothetical protein